MARWEDEGYVNGHWGTRGSGVLFVAPGRRFLLLRRSQKIHKPGLWGLPGGAVPVDKQGRYQDDWISAKREVLEEAGHRVRGKPLLVLRNVTPDGFVFTTFVLQAPKVFPAKLSWEHDDWRWVTRKEAQALPLHPGIKGVLDLSGNLNGAGQKSRLLKGQIREHSPGAGISLTSLRRAPARVREAVKALGARRNEHHLIYHLWECAGGDPKARCGLSGPEVEALFLIQARLARGKRRGQPADLIEFLDQLDYELQNLVGEREPSPDYEPAHEDWTEDSWEGGEEELSWRGDEARAAERWESERGWAARKYEKALQDRGVVRKGGRIVEIDGRAVTETNDGLRYKGSGIRVQRPDVGFGPGMAGRRWGASTSVTRRGKTFPASELAALIKKGGSHNRTSRSLKKRIVREARKIRNKKYGVCSSTAGVCLYDALSVIEAAKKHKVRLVLQGGTAFWRRMSPDQDDGFSPTHFGYQWDPRSPLSEMAVAQGNLPEMHVWAGDPATQEVVDIATLDFPTRAQDLIGYPWLDVKPPGFFWGTGDELPDGAFYEPNREATLYADKAARKWARQEEEDLVLLRRLAKP